MSSAAVAERLRAAEEKNRQLSEENRALNVRLAAVEEQLAQRNREFAAVEAKNGEFLQEKRHLAERLAKAKELVGELVATVPELAPRFDGGGSGGGGGGCGSSRSDGGGNRSGAPQHSGERAAEPAGLGEPTTVAISPALAQKTPLIGLLFPPADHIDRSIMLGVKDIPAVRDMLEKARGVLGIDVLKFCLEAPEEQILERREALTYIACLAGLEKLRHEREEAVTRAQVMAGMDVGQWAALAAAGVFSFEDGLKWMSLNCEAVWKAGAASKQASVFVAGLSKPMLAELCATAAKKGGSGALCQITNEMFSLGFGVAGTEKAVLALQNLAEKAGAFQVVAGSKPCALHTVLMKPAEESMRSALLTDWLPKMSSPKTTVYMASVAAPIRPGASPRDIGEILVKESSSPLLWEPSIKAMIGEGISEFYEVGHGKRLKHAMKHINNKAWRTMTNIEV